MGHSHTGPVLAGKAHDGDKPLNFTQSTGAIAVISPKSNPKHSGGVPPGTIQAAMQPNRTGLQQTEALAQEHYEVCPEESLLLGCPASGYRHPEQVIVDYTYPSRKHRSRRPKGRRVHRGRLIKLPSCGQNVDVATTMKLNRRLNTRGGMPEIDRR